MKKLVLCGLLSSCVGGMLGMETTQADANVGSIPQSSFIYVSDQDWPLFLVMSSLDDSKETKQKRRIRSSNIKQAIGDGANPNQHYCNPLFYAVTSRNLNLAVFLVNHGADMNFVGQSGFSAKSYIQSYFTPRKQENFLEALEDNAPAF